MHGFYPVRCMSFFQLDSHAALRRQVDISRDRVAERVLEVILHRGDDRAVSSCNLALDVSAPEEVIQRGWAIQHNARCLDLLPSLLDVRDLSCQIEIIDVDQRGTSAASC